MTVKPFQKKRGKASLIKGGVAFAFVLFIIFFAYFGNGLSFFHPNRLRILLEKAGFLAPLWYMIIMALAVIISPIPSVPLDAAAGAFFGPYLGTLYSALGALGGAIASFLIARFLGRKFIERFLRGHINLCSGCSDKLLTKVVFLARLLPFISFDIVSYGAGLTKMSLRKFILATFLGMLPLTFVYNYFGAVLVAGGGLSLVLGIVIVFLLFLFPIWIERYDLFSLRRFFRHDKG
jgi:uncharacterized membrane protein YdjX (TVP38/TMEM64 family)